jgi:uncharacterized membrane protein YhaH (DUF805 family)
MGIAEAVQTVLTKNYVNFQGRAARPEYWWYILFYVIAYLVLVAIDAALGMQLLAVIFALAVLLPTLAVTVRRLHDLDKSGWWILIGFVPIVGAILLIYWYAQPGTPGDNRFGPQPVA